MRRHYSRITKQRIVLFIALAVLAVILGFWAGTKAAKAAMDEPVTCWVLCQPGPGSRVNVRRTPDRHGQVVGYLEAGDSFRTNAESKNGYIRVLDVGEYGEAWVYCGFVATEEPEAVFENYCCVAKTRVACRKWIGGPQVGEFPWLVNGSTVSVFYIADGWAVTNRGYIRAEWLEVDLT